MNRVGPGLAQSRIVVALHGDEARAGGGPGQRGPRLAAEMRRLGADAACVTAPDPRLNDADLVHMLNVWDPLSGLRLARRVGETGARLVFSPIHLDQSESALWRDQIPAAAAVAADPDAFGQRVAEIAAHAAGTARDHGREPAPGYLAMLREMIRRADRVICLSEHERRLLRMAGADTERMDLVRNPVDAAFCASADPSMFRAAYGSRDFVLCVARIDPRKNQLLLLEALRGTGLPVVLIGGDDCSGYAAALRLYKGADLHVAGRIDSRAMIASAMAAARVFALPSFAEGAPLAALEAAAAGTPLALSDRSAEREYFGDRAWYCDPLSPASIREAVVAAWDTPRDAANLSAFVARRYGWARHARRMEEIYGETLARPAPVRVGGQPAGMARRKLCLGEVVDFTARENLDACACEGWGADGGEGLTLIGSEAALTPIYAEGAEAALTLALRVSAADDDGFTPDGGRFHVTVGGAVVGAFTLFAPGKLVFAFRVGRAALAQAGGRIGIVAAEHAGGLRLHALMLAGRGGGADYVAFCAGVAARHALWPGRLLDLADPEAPTRFLRASDSQATANILDVEDGPVRLSLGVGPGGAARITANGAQLADVDSGARATRRLTVDLPPHLRGVAPVELRVEVAGPAPPPMLTEVGVAPCGEARDWPADPCAGQGAADGVGLGEVLLGARLRPGVSPLDYRGPRRIVVPLNVTPPAFWRRQPAFLCTLIVHAPDAEWMTLTACGQIHHAAPTDGRLIFSFRLRAGRMQPRRRIAFTFAPERPETRLRLSYLRIGHYPLNASARMIAVADACRDVGLWAEASRRYGAALTGMTDKGRIAAIRVQQGHMLKEAGDLSGAEAAYRAALALRPGDPETLLQLGHLYDRWRRAEDARQWYRRAAKVAPENAAITAYLARLSAPGRPSDNP